MNWKTEPHAIWNCRAGLSRTLIGARKETVYNMANYSPFSRWIRNISVQVTTLYYSNKKAYWTHRAYVHSPKISFIFSANVFFFKPDDGSKSVACLSPCRMESTFNFPRSLCETLCYCFPARLSKIFLYYVRAQLQTVNPFRRVLSTVNPSGLGCRSPRKTYRHIESLSAASIREPTKASLIFAHNLYLTILFTWPCAYLRNRISFECNIEIAEFHFIDMLVHEQKSLGMIGTHLTIFKFFLRN